MNTFTASTSATSPVTVLLPQLRRERRLSQLELSLRVGVSQRHLSCIETGRARPSREMLIALLDALDAPLPRRCRAATRRCWPPATRRTIRAARSTIPTSARCARRCAICSTRTTPRPRWCWTAAGTW
ncbi:helix-turn-helix domain-containing protein [Mitsuaria sp. BK037]|uniref:helix-turn-helix domain-containing protein n=1 Tax=Mitsuaria sp. BK037 TaxID=2587122 RepID=UPI00185B94A4|nr:helix-turn-helix transcriptional regulator [Mitsuaria sp. BK037]MBB3283779.1 DNA-binding XRE family transcriptional regulator [Mitsuaria sp. BK037]